MAKNSKTNYGENASLNVHFGRRVTVPSTWYIAAHVVPKWQPNTAYSVGAFVTPTTGSPNRVYRCTTAGTSGSTEPSWPNIDNATVNDGTCVWTEATDAMEAGNVPSEPSGGGYARVAVPNDTTNWPAASVGQTSNSTDIVFPVATADWGQVAVVSICDAATGGNRWWIGTLVVFRDILNGDQFRIPAGQLTITED